MSEIQTARKGEQPPWTPVPILMYHAVEDELRSASYNHHYVTAAEFRGQIDELRERGYQAVSLDTLHAGMSGKTALPPKPVVLTFDDGYINLHKNAHPLLAGIGWPYTVYLVSGKVGGINEWDAAHGYPEKSLLTWEQIAEMRTYPGAAFEAHTSTHPDLTARMPDDVRQEIIGCKEELEQRLGRPVRHFCFPYGHFNDQIVRITREAGFLTATTTQHGRVRRGDDPLLLPRVSIYHVPPFSFKYGPGWLNFRWRVESRRDKRPASGG